MRSMFAYFSPTDVEGNAVPREQRCLHALQAVATGWLLAAVIPGLFASNLAVSVEGQHRLWVFELVCLLISAAIYSVLLPLRHILREKKD